MISENTSTMCVNEDPVVAKKKSVCDTLFILMCCDDSICNVSWRTVILVLIRVVGRPFGSVNAYVSSLTRKMKTCHWALNIF